MTSTSPRETPVSTAKPPGVDPSAIRRVLLIAPSWVGDLVMATPAIRALGRHFENAELTALVRPVGADVLEHNPHIARFVVADRRGRGPESENGRQLGRLLRRSGFDLAVILPNSFHAALIAWRARAGRRVGYVGQWRTPLLTDRLPRPRENGKVVPINMVDRYLRLCRAVGCEDLSRTEELFASDEDRSNAASILESVGVAPGDRLAVLIPGASFGPAKQWGAEKFARVGDGLIERYGMKVIAHVGPGEGATGDALAAASRKGVIVPPPKTIDLKVLKPVIERAEVVISNDTGPRHYAVAYDVPNVAILGPTSRRYIDVNLDRTALLQADVPCGPCQRRVCPEDHACMERITPEQVLAAAASLGLS